MPVPAQALEVPDPRSELVPPGWALAVAAPAIAAMTTWAELDEAEARLQAVLGFFDALGDDVIEYEKALRLLEMRRGEMLGEPAPGRRTDLLPAEQRPPPDSPSPATMSRWRALARHREALVPVIMEATNRHQVTQTRLLRLVESEPAEGAEPAQAREGAGRSAEPESVRLLRRAARAYLDQGGDRAAFLRVAGAAWDRVAGERGLV